jgi:HEPN domain-containing protein
MVGVEKINLIELDKVRQLLEISEKDLEASEKLFICKLYHNSVLTFQQSVEKTVKAWSLMNNLFRFDELKKGIGHNPLHMYESNVSKHLQEAENLKEAIKNQPELSAMPFVQQLNLEDYISNAEFVKNFFNSISKGKKIFSDDLNELDGGIEEMNKLIEHVKSINMQEIIEKGVEIYKKAYTDSVKIYIEISEKQGKPISEEEKEQNLNVSDGTIKGIADNLRKDLVLIGITSALNSTLSLFITPHFDFVRYPEKKNPLEYYTEKNPLIMRFAKLITIQKENLAFHKEYLEIIERYYKNHIRIEK